MRIKPEHARRACREFVSKRVIPRELSIDPHAFCSDTGGNEASDLLKDHPQSEMQACVDLRFLSVGEDLGVQS